MTEYLSIDPSRIPHPKFSTREVRAVECAIKAAWAGLVKEPHQVDLSDINGASEVELTDALQRALDRLRRAGIHRWFSEKTFETPVRDESVRSFDGKSLEKRPDLTFRPVFSATRKISCGIQDGLFVECKLFKEATPKACMRPYVSNGICRFTKGDYAWAMPHAMMVAYNRSGVSKADGLALLYEEPTKLTCQLADNSPPISHQDSSPDSVSLTRHERYFSVKGRSVGEIELRHIWLLT